MILAKHKGTNLNRTFMRHTHTHAHTHIYIYIHTLYTYIHTHIYTHIVYSYFHDDVLQLVDTSFLQASICKAGPDKVLMYSSNPPFAGLSTDWAVGCLGKWKLQRCGELIPPRNIQKPGLDVLYIYIYMHICMYIHICICKYICISYIHIWSYMIINAYMIIYA